MEVDTTARPCGTGSQYVCDVSQSHISHVLCRRRITARECLAHPWMNDVTFTQPIRSHYQSSTSVDSSISLSMDNMVSSTETSPISSATSSFAAGQSSYDTNYPVPLEECTTMEEGKDSGIGHRVSPSQLSSSLTQGLSDALVLSVRRKTSSDDTQPQSRSNSSDWLSHQRELSSSPSWGEQSGRSPSIDSTASGNGTTSDETALVKRVSASSRQDDNTVIPAVALGDTPPSSRGGKASAEAQSTSDSLSQTQLCDTPQLPSAESRPVVRGEKEVSPEVNKADEVLRLLHEGLSLTKAGSEGSMPNMTNASSCPSIEHRQLYTGSSGRSLTASSGRNLTASSGRSLSASKSVPSTSPRPGLSPARDMSSARSSSAGTQHEMLDVMRLLTVGVPLTEGKERTDAEQEQWANRGGSRQADKPAESDLLKLLRVGITPESPLWHQKDMSSGSVSPQLGASPQRRRTSKPRPDSFILPVEVQEAILKGELDLAMIEEAAEGKHPSPEKGKSLGALATQRHRTAWN